LLREVGDINAALMMAMIWSPSNSPLANDLWLLLEATNWL